MDLLAVTESSYKKLLSALSITETEFQSMDDGDYWGEKIGNGWVFLRATRGNYSLVTKTLTRISAECEFYSAMFSGVTMFSCVSFWSHGQKLWEVSHSSEDGWKDLTVSGKPPSQLADIRKRLFAEQHENGGRNSLVNYIFNVPIDLLGSIINYDFDRCDTGGDLVGYQPLAQESA